MKISQATWVRYHHFDLARELDQLGVLHSIFATLPYWRLDAEAKQNGIDRKKIHGFPYVTAARRAMRILTRGAPAIDEKFAVLDTKIYSRWLAQQVGNVDAFIGISGTGLHAGKRVQEQGGIYVMDRGSAHIRESNRILQEEYTRWGADWRPINSWLMDNEDAEAETANLITVPSEFVAGTFRARGVPASKVKVVPYGVNLAEFYPPNDYNFGAQHTIFRLIFVGNFSIRKGAGYLLEAMKVLEKIGFNLTVVGNVPPETIPIIEKFNVRAIKFVGVVSRVEVRKYLVESDALVLPSVEEGLALVQAQSLACGCPVIVTPNTGCESLIEHMKHGMIIEGQSSTSIVNAAIFLRENQDIRFSMRDKGIALTKKLGGWRTYAENIVNVLSGINK